MRDRTGLKVRTVAVVSTLVAAMLLLLSLVPFVSAAVPWTQPADDVSIEETGLDELFVIDCWVVKNSDYDYQMWYTHSRADMSPSELATGIADIITGAMISSLVNLELDTLLEEMATIDASALWDFMTAMTTIIGYAESTDGINWNIVDDEVLAGASDAWYNYGAPCVIKDDDTYEMWFTHSDTSLTSDNIDDFLLGLGSTDTATARNAIIGLINGTGSAIGYATSTDSTTWNIIDTDIVPAAGGGVWDIVAAPSVIKNGSDYEMWYTYADASLTTDDIDDIVDEIEADTFDSDDLWSIFNTIDSVIGYAISTDGETWSIDNPSVISNGSGLWNAVGTPCVIENGGVYEIWYTSLTTDLNAGSFQTLMNEIKDLEPYISTLWGNLEDEEWDGNQQRRPGRQPHLRAGGGRLGRGQP